MLAGSPPPPPPGGRIHTYIEKNRTARCCNDVYKVSVCSRVCALKSTAAANYRHVFGGLESLVCLAGCCIDSLNASDSRYCSS